MKPAKFLEWTEQDRIDILKAYDRTPESMAEDVESIKRWIEQQPHLPEMPADDAIENFMLLNKCSIEKTKQKIDWYYTMRALVPEFYGRHPLSPEMIETAKTRGSVLCPKLTHDLYRISVCKVTNSPVRGVADMEMLFAHVLNISELRLREDRCLGNILVFDITDAKMSILNAITPMLLKKMYSVGQKVFSARYKELHIVHKFTSVEALITIGKAILSEKHKKRLFVHTNYEALHKYIDKDILPKELGGNGPTIDELTEVLMEKLTEYKDRFDKLSNMKTNEALRPGKPINDDVLGFQGNFKQLAFD